MTSYAFSIPSTGRCELYGDPHYISFQGVTFDFLDDCTYILVEEQSPRHHLTIAVDNYYCVPGLPGSCAKGIILQYHSNIATLSIIPDMYEVQVGYNKTLFISTLLFLYIKDADFCFCDTEIFKFKTLSKCLRLRPLV